MTRLFVSLSAYAFGKQHWPDVTEAERREIALGLRSTVPGFRTVARLRMLTDVELHTDHSTLIGRARDRAAGRFLRSACDQWVMVDDDVDADFSACEFLLRKPRWSRAIIVAAMRMRTLGEDAYNVVRFPDDAGEALVTHEPFIVHHAGFAFARIPRGPLQVMAEHFASNEWEEPCPDMGRASGPASQTLDRAPGLFLEFIKARRWLGEDGAFCERANDAGVPIHAVILPGVTHAGIPNVKANQ